MRKVRVYQLAKELKVQSALILELLDRLGADVKSDLSVLDSTMADLVRGKVTAALDVEKQRLADERQELEREAEQQAEEQAEQQAEQQAEREAEQQAEPPTETAPAEAPATGPEVETPAPASAPTPVPPTPSVETPAQPIAAAPTATTPRATPAPTPPPAASTAPVSPGGPASSRPAVPGQRKPRVFPARRIPTPASLVQAQAARTGAGRAAPYAPPRPPVPGRTTGMPPRPGPGRGLPPGGPRKRRKKDRTKERSAATQPVARPKVDLPPVPAEITLSEGVTVKELGEKLNRKSKDVIAKLLGRGVLATINQPLNPETAIAVAEEFGSKAKVISFEEEAQKPELPDGLVPEAESAGTEPRPPVITVMGHVDHGKTSLLDAIRTANVAGGEAGGITQHIGAYQVELKNRKITFLDTPGHEAFTMMRARGAKATDIVVLVIAAEDGVKPQTAEAIDHAKAAGVPIIVAINKIDKPNANPDRVKQQLMEHDLVVEDYGGEIVACEISAKQKKGIDHLLEMILLVADLKEMRSDSKRSATGIVLEARLDRNRGTLATLLVQNGTLKVGDVFIAGTAYGKVRAMTDENGTKVAKAGPSTPVEVMGFADDPAAGDSFQAIADEAKARQIATFRQDRQRADRLQSNVATTLEAFSDGMQTGSTKELRLLLKADAQGSIEALQKTLGDLPSDKIKVNVLRTSVGAITQADVLLATASNALVVGFNVRPNKDARDLARREGIQLRLYSVIYDLVDEIKAAMVGMLDPTLKESVLGQATVRQPFKIPRIGTIAGSYVTEGKVTRKAEVRLLRDNIVIFTGKVGSLKRFKEDVAEVKLGYECGIGIENYNDIKENDVIEFFVIEKIAQASL